MWDNTTSSASDISQLIGENVHGLQQLARLVSALSEVQYRQRFGLKGQHVTGKHVRHLIDHYETFFRALNEGAEGRFNYEHRRREESLESDPQLACRHLLSLCRSLERLANEQHQRPLSMEHTTAAGAVISGTSVGRELIFLSSHTIHHMAIIGLIVEHQGIQPDSDFGVHPSTWRHWQREEARLAQTS